MSAAALLAGAAITLAPAPVMAACDDNAPSSGQTVTCTDAAPNPDTTGIDGAASSNVSVTVQGDATIRVTDPGTAAIRLGGSGGHTVTLEKEAWITSAGDAIVLTGDDDKVLIAAGEVWAGTGADAVRLEDGMNTLELRNGYDFRGNVVGTGYDTLTFGGASGEGSAFDLSKLGTQFTGFNTLRKTGKSLWVLLGDGSGYSGTTMVNEGLLSVDGKLGGTTYVLNGAQLLGDGTLDDLNVRDGGVVAPGGHLVTGTLTTNSLTLSPNAYLSFDLNTPGVIGGDNDHIVVNGALWLDGTLAVQPGPGFGAGLYTLISYGNLDANEGVRIDDTITSIEYSYDINAGPVNAGPGAVTLLISPGGQSLFWDGAGAGNDGAVAGGAGVWNATNLNWTNVDGSANRTWNGGLAIFSGTSGVVRVEGTQQVMAMQFLTDGYVLAAGAGGTFDPSSGLEVRVDDGASARIEVPFRDDPYVTKRGAGTLTLASGPSPTFDDMVARGAILAEAGTVRLVDGMTAQLSRFEAGDGADLDASVILSGSGTTLNSSGASIGGDGGSGSFRVEEGATFRIIDIFGAFGVGDGNGGTGTVTVTGAGSMLDSGWGMWVQNGTLDVTDGGTVRAIRGDTISGQGAGDAARASVTGAGSTWENGENLRIGYGGADGSGGDHGFGSLRVADGGLLRAPGVDLAFGADTTARLIVGGEGAAMAPGILDAPAISFGAGTGTLVFNHTSTGLAFAPALTSAAVGTHAVEVLAGVTRLTADSSAFDGTTSLRGGRLDVTGTLGGAVFVTGGGTLGGTGGIGALTVAGGRIAPGLGVPGTLTVQGDVTFDAGSTLAVRIAGDGGNDRLAVTGTATVAGDVEVTALDPSASYENGQAYTILTATDGVSGTFAQALSKSAFLTPTLTHNADDVVLTIALGDDPTEPTKPVTGLFTTAAETPNQEQAATGLDGLEQSGDALAVYNTLLMMNAGDARRAFDLSSGEIHAAGRHVIDQTFALFNRTLRYQGVAGIGSGNVGTQVFTAPLGYGPAVAAAIDDATTSPYADTRVRGAWAAPLGGSGQFDDDGNAARLDWWNAGLAGGYEGVMDVTSGEAVGGFGFGYIHARGTVDDRLSTFDSDGFYLGAYGAWVDGPWNVAGSLSYGANRVSTERNIAFMGRTAKANYWTHTVGLSGEASYAFDLARTTRLAPLFTLDASWSGHGGFTETGAGALNLTARSESWTRLDAGLGIALTHTVLTDSGRVTLEGRAVWEHAFADVVPSQSLALAGSPTGFTVLGPDAGRDRLRIGAGVSWNVSADVTLRARYDGLFSGNQANHSGFVGLNVRF